MVEDVRGGIVTKPMNAIMGDSCGPLTNYIPIAMLEEMEKSPPRLEVSDDELEVILRRLCKWL